ncbi:sigma-70 family RNA polymerase sigma factor [Burkholderia sp. Cy-637]|uniref:sigma-70 family RNA polymerase sigma factor n=1 Tax=Burkholderia sp. Cy-637 TaxID=2608327 RepID=UPI0014240AB5|nr:sigma-70 family RNA polymerase sigma factor [Burkholderia sp. Cy-637]NIF93323.1 sigma-70 family RNA polymerase sigma factor [Burkholderia sp. Cy-637]
MSAVLSDVQREVSTLYLDHHAWLQGWLRRKLGNASDAADLAQDTFVRVLSAWSGAGGFDPRELREPRAYLSTVAGRLVLNHYRRLSLERAWLEALALLPEACAPSVEERCLVLETLHEIDAMLDRLPPNVRTAFLLSQLEGLTYAEIALRLGISDRTVKRYMVSAYEACLLLAL